MIFIPFHPSHCYFLNLHHFQVLRGQESARRCVATLKDSGRRSPSAAPAQPRYVGGSLIVSVEIQWESQHFQGLPSGFMTNIAVENHHFFMGKSLWSFSMVMLNYQRLAQEFSGYELGYELEIIAM